jgi:hypothetical protein
VLGVTDLLGEPGAVRQQLHEPRVERVDAAAQAFERVGQA